jgi:hypothetical protein
MKISIGTKIKNTAWGGGNNFAKNLANYMKEKGVDVYFDLKEKNIDLIILTDPRSKSMSSNFDDLDIIKYQMINNKTLVLHRINECDERKNTNFVNGQLLKANRVADHTVFISTWLKKLLINFGFNSSNSSVILNGADKNIFSFSENTWSKGKIKIITHHWSNHPNKGAKTYKMMDNLMNKKEWNEKVEFYYVGNPPKNIKFVNTKVIKPLSGKDLSNFLSSCHIYLTGSINEPGGNHQNEGANIGLPILYLNSGCMKEYCDNYGVAFNHENFEVKLLEIIKNYKDLKNNLKNYPYNSANTCSQYFELISKMYKNRDLITSKKTLPKLSFKEEMIILFRKLKIS